MNKSMLRLYAPFIAVAVVQALFVTVAPSRPASREVVAGGTLPAPGDPGFVDDGTTFDFGDGTVGDGTGTLGGSGTGAGTGGSTSRRGTAGTTPGGSPGGGGGGGGGGTSAAAQFDRSGCKGNYQFDHLHSNPLCVGRWLGTDNGGATYQGVTADEIKIVFFGPVPNAAVDAILAQQGLARTEQDEERLFAAATEFINKNYELYGRKIRIIERDQAPCPQTPPDPPPCIEAAREVIKNDKPFMVLWDSGLYPTVFNEFAKAGVVTIGGWHFSEEYFTGFRPYRYDVFMDGTRSVRMLAEYWCKNLAGKNASHTGRVIHQDIGLRDQVRRRLGISVPATDANIRTADLLKQLVMECDAGAKEPVIVKYESNIETAASQADNTAASYIDAGVTTITCLCDPIAPAFSSKAYTKNNYFPEQLVSGIGLLDFDKLGRLYDSEQWAHAFGPSHLQVQPVHSDSDASRMWRATGRTGTPCESCNLPWSYVALAASLLQGAGPNLTPVSIESAALSSPGIGGWEASGRNPHVVKISFAPGDYTGIDDVKEVYWSETATSTIDGQPRAYVNVGNGRRYTAGELPGSFEQRIPVPSR